MAERFPLEWPAVYPRAGSRGHAKFKTSFWAAVNRLYRELELMGADTVVVSTNIPLRKDGLPYADPPMIKDPGVAIYFRLKGSPMSMACDAWERVDDNAQALCLTVEAMRGLDRWGASDMLNRVFQGFTALPAPEQKCEWWTILQAVHGHAPIAFYEDQYRSLVKKYHPDVPGGSHERMSELNRAITQARVARGRT